MKKLFKNFLLMGGIASTLFFTACDDTTDGPVVDGPTLSLDSDLAVSYSEGEDVSLVYSFTAPGQLGQIKYKLLIDGAVSRDTVFIPSELGLSNTDTTGTFGFDLTLTDGLGGSNVVAEITVVDRSNQEVVNDDASFSVTDGVLTYETTLLGGFLNNTAGSFYDALSDSVYRFSTIQTSAANRSSIDFVYYFVDNTSTGSVLAAPNNAEAGITWNEQTTPQTWPFTASSNATTFKIAAQGTNFDFINSNTDLLSAYGEVGTPESRMTKLTEGALIAFKIADARGGRYGLIEVTSIDGTNGSTRAITINVKIQSTDNN